MSIMCASDIQQQPIELVG